ncbi:unnamed protein product [Closterium sp. NIES-64]|nr:unnamed protein product [Closterium sp. NIES-64]
MPAFLPPLFSRRPALQPAASAPIAAPGTSFRVFQPITFSRRGSAPAAPAPAAGTLPRGPGAAHVARVALLVAVAAALIACDVLGLHPWHRNVAQVAQAGRDGQAESQRRPRGAGEGGETGGDGGASDSGGGEGITGSNGRDTTSGGSTDGDNNWGSSGAVEYRGAPWKADVGRWLLVCGDQLSPVTVGEVLFSRACPGNCSGNGVCNHELGECRCRHGFSGPDCSQLHLLQCNLPASPEWPMGTWVASICPAHCDTTTALCFCGNGTRFPHRPITHPCGFVYRSHEFVYSEVDTDLLFHAHTSYCNGSSVTVCASHPPHHPAPSPQEPRLCVQRGGHGSALSRSHQLLQRQLCDCLCLSPTTPPPSPRNHDFVYSEVDTDLLFHAHTGYCNADPRVGFQRDYTGCGMCDVDGYLGPFCDVRVESYCVNQCSRHGTCHRGYCESYCVNQCSLHCTGRATEDTVSVHMLSSHLLQWAVRLTFESSNVISSHPLLTTPPHSSLQCSDGFFGIDCSVPSAFTPPALFTHPSESLQLDSPHADVASTAADASLAGKDGGRGSGSSTGDPDGVISMPGDAAGSTSPGDVQRRVLHGAGGEETHHRLPAQLAAAAAAEGSSAAAAAAAAGAAGAAAAGGAGGAEGTVPGWQRRVENLAAQQQVKPFVRRQWELRRWGKAAGSSSSSSSSSSKAAGSSSSSRRWVRWQRPLIYVYDLPGEFTFHHMEARKIRAYCTTRLYGMRNETLYNFFQLYGMEVSTRADIHLIRAAHTSQPHLTTNASFCVFVMGGFSFPPPHPVSLPAPTAPPMHQQQTIFSLALFKGQVAVIESLLASTHRTTNASAADYFFVPVMGGCITARADDSPATLMQGVFTNRRAYFAADHYQRAYL